MVYDLGYRFRDQHDFVADLRFAGISPPVPHLEGAPPFTGSSHFDQHGRVTGELQLLGERIPVDCISVRDRSWGRRPELLGRRTRFSYCFGASSPDEAFLAFCRPDTHLVEAEQLLSGYLIRDGMLRRLATASRVNERDPETGGVARVLLDARDTDGRELHAVADAVSRMALSGSGGGLTVNTMLRWSIDGARTGWGEDQEVWSLPRAGSTSRRTPWAECYPSKRSMGWLRCQPSMVNVICLRQCSSAPGASPASMSRTSFR